MSIRFEQRVVAIQRSLRGEQPYGKTQVKRFRTGSTSSEVLRAQPGYINFYTAEILDEHRMTAIQPAVFQKNIRKRTKQKCFDIQNTSQDNSGTKYETRNAGFFT